MVSKESRKRLNYTVACVNEFARRKHIHPSEAFLYLYQHQPTRKRVFTLILPHPSTNCIVTKMLVAVSYSKRFVVNPMQKC